MTERRLVMLPRAADALRRLPPARKRKVREALRDLRRGGAVGRPLDQELTGLSRIRVGDLRLIYREEGRTLVFVAIGPRRTIYTELEREARAAKAGR